MPLRTVLTSLLDILAPERCVLCDRDREARPWCARGPVVGGLRRWDEPHLCGDCGHSLGSIARRTEVEGLTVWAGATTGADLAAVVAQWKYRGLRGLAWPLSGLLATAWPLLPPGISEHCLLVPVPLHRRRRRERGFNQAEMLAKLLARERDLTVASGLVRRARATPQQAQLDADPERVANVRGAFRARPPRGQGEADEPLLLVDDIVTSGATAGAAAAALTAAGWHVEGVLALATSLPGDSGPGPC